MTIQENHKDADLLDVPDVNLHLQVLDLNPVLLLGKLSDALDNHVPQAAPVRPAGFAEHFHGVLPLHHRVPEDHTHCHQPCALVIAHRGNIDVAHPWKKFELNFTKEKLIFEWVG